MRFLKVWDTDGSYCVTAEGEQSLDAAVTQYLAEGRDSLVRLTWLDGDDYTTRASIVKAWAISSPEGRVKSCEIEAEQIVERKENRMAAGLPWEDE